MKDDTISRAAAVDTVKNHYRAIDNDLLEIIAYEMERLPSAQPGWIPCSERLPNPGETVLVTHKSGVSFAWHNGKYWERGASTNHREMRTVVAWMPLPPKWEGDANG